MERIEKIVNKPENAVCADCSAKNPRWASISIGVVLCIRCCGVHRNLGTHISRVKSCVLDQWSEETLQVFEALDNSQCNQYWERYLQGSVKPDEHSSDIRLQNFIRDKYERRCWAPSGANDPVSALNINNR